VTVSAISDTSATAPDTQAIAMPANYGFLCSRGKRAVWAASASYAKLAAPGFWPVRANRPGMKPFTADMPVSAQSPWPAARQRRWHL